MVNGIVFDDQLITSSNFAHFIYTFLNGCSGVTKGCEISHADGSIFIQKGYFVQHGRFVQIVGAEEIATPQVLSGKMYCKVVFEIDLSKENTEETFVQGQFKTLSSESAYPELTQQDLDAGGTIYQMPWCQYIKTSAGISELTDLRQMITLSNIWNVVMEQNEGYRVEFEEYFTSQKASVEQMIQDLADQGYLKLADYKKETEIVLKESDWIYEDGQYKQTINVEGMLETDKPDYGIRYPLGCTKEQKKVVDKAIGYLCDMITAYGAVTFVCVEKPTTDLTVVLKGV